MDFEYIINLVYEFAYFIGVFGIFFIFSIFKGRQSVMNIIMGLYLALLISIEFPNYEQLFGGVQSSQSEAILRLAFFVFIALFTTALCYRIMPDEFREEKFESIGKKLLLSLGATILVMIFSFHVLPITEFLTPGTPIQSIFAPDLYFFWWLLAPLVILYIV